jgi:BCD family chlorophyll transporter-like MFS transporter
MGLWGAAQAMAFGLGGLVGTGVSDLARWWIEQDELAYACVFFFEVVLFTGSAWWALRVGHSQASAAVPSLNSPSWAQEGQQS